MGFACITLLCLLIYIQVEISERYHLEMFSIKTNESLVLRKPETEQERAQSKLCRTKHRGTCDVPAACLWTLSLYLISGGRLCSAPGEVSFLMESRNTASSWHLLLSWNILKPSGPGSCCGHSWPLLRHSRRVGCLLCLLSAALLTEAA